MCVTQQQRGPAPSLASSSPRAAPRPATGTKIFSTVLAVRGCGAWPGARPSVPRPRQRRAVIGQAVLAGVL